MVDETFTAWSGGSLGYSNGNCSFGMNSPGTGYGEWKTSESGVKFDAGETVQSTLDLSARTLTMKNITRNGPEVVVCRALPSGRTFYPAVGVSSNVHVGLEMLPPLIDEKAAA